MEKALSLEIPAEPLADFCRRNEVQELALFGSAVTGPLERRATSTFWYLPAWNTGRIPDARRMQRELEGLLGRKVDLVPKGD